MCSTGCAAPGSSARWSTSTISPMRSKRISCAAARDLEVVDLGRAQAAARDRRRAGQGARMAAATIRSSASTATISGSTARSTRSASSRQRGTTRGWTRCCCWSPLARAQFHRGQGRFPHGCVRARSPGAASRGGSRRSSIPASRSSRRACSAMARGAVLHQPVLGARDRGGPRLRRRAPGTVVRGRHAACDPRDGGGAGRMAEGRGLHRLLHPAASGVCRRARAGLDPALWRRSDAAGAGHRAGADQSRQRRRSPTRSCARAEAGCCCRGWWPSAISISTRRRGRCSIRRMMMRR